MNEETKHPNTLNVMTEQDKGRCAPAPGSETRRLRKALREIRAQLDPHMDQWDNEIPQDPDCFCIRCIAVRALSPNAKGETRRPAASDSH